MPSLRSHVLALSALALALAACSSGPDEAEEPKPVFKYKPPPPPPLDDLVRQAEEAEEVGNETKSFNAVFGLDEAVRAYQRIVDHYPESDAAGTAKEKVREIGEKVRTVREWKRRLQAARKEIPRMSSAPGKMHDYYQGIVNMTLNAPEGYVKEAAFELLEEVREIYERGALDEVEAAKKKVADARRRGDLREALQALKTLPEAYVEDLATAGERIEALRAELEGEARNRAENDLERARSALRKRQERQAVYILRQAWKDFRGFEVVRDILREERKAVLQDLKVALADASGQTRSTDVELFNLMDRGAGLDPDDPADRETLREQLEGYRAFINRYLAGTDALWCTRRDFEIRKNFLEKLIDWERERMP